MNAQVNSDSIHNLSTGNESVIPAREQSLASVVRKDMRGEWTGKTQWLFNERPALAGDELGQWIIELRTSKGSRGIGHSWNAMQAFTTGTGFAGTRFMMFGDFSLLEPAHNSASRATSKAIAEAHTLAVQQIERIAAAAVEFYKAKQPQG